MQGYGMFWLVEAQIAAARQLDPCDRAPSFLVHFGTSDAALAKRLQFGLEVVAHEIQLVRPIAVAGMERRLRRRQRKNQPSMARIHRRETKNVPEERPIRIGILAVDDDMRPEDHRIASPATILIHKRHFAMAKGRTFSAGSTLGAQRM